MWIEVSRYYACNFEAIKSFVLGMLDDSCSITACKRILQLPNLAANLLIISTHFNIIPTNITQLEKRGMLLKDSLDVIFKVKQSFEMSGEVCSFALEKLNKCLSNNPGWKTICAINQSMIGTLNALPEAWSI